MLFPCWLMLVPVRDWLQATEQELVMSNYRQPTLNMFAMGLRTNRGMFELLRTVFRVDGDLDEHVLANLLSDDVMASATCIGNEPLAAACASLMAFYRDLVQLGDDAFLVETWEALLGGKCEMVKGLQKIRKSLPLPMLGDFKLYFVSKCLRNVFSNLVVAPFVGSNQLAKTLAPCTKCLQITSIPACRRQMCIY